MVALTQKKMSPTGALVETFKRLKRVNPNRVQAGEIGTGILEGLQRSYEEGSFDFKAINYKALLEQVITPSMRRAWSAENWKENTKLHEHTLDVLTSTQFDAVMKMCVRLTAFQQCAMAPYVMGSLVDNSPRIDCNMGKLIGYPRVDSSIIDTNEEELEETQFYGLQQPYFIGMPKAHKKKFAVGYSREILCVNANTNNLITQQINDLEGAFDEHKEFLLTDLIFGLYPVGKNPYKYDFNETKFDGWQAVGGGAPWGNLIVGDPNTVVDGTSFAPFRAVEQIFDEMRDPIDQKPIQCPGGLQILVTKKTKIEVFQDMLGIIQFTRDVTGGTTNEKMEITRSPREGWSADIKYSRHSYDRLTEFHREAEGKTQAEAEAIVEDTWVAGHFDQAFAWATEWDRENITLAGNQNWPYFNQEIVFMTKWMEKTTPMWKAPWQAVRMRPAA